VETTRVPVAASISVAALFLALGIASGVLMAARGAAQYSAEQAPSPAPGARPAKNAPMSGRTSTQPPSPDFTRLPEELVAGPTKPQTLTDRLERLRKILIVKGKDGMLRSDFQDIDRAMAAGWPEMHQAALKDPASYFAFLRAHGNEDVCDGLLDVLCIQPSLAGYRLRLAQELPPAVLDGIMDLMSTGGKAQQLAAAKFARDLTRGTGPGKRDVLLEPCLSLLSSDDPRAQAVALEVLQSRCPERLEESMPLVQVLWKKSEGPEVRVPCLSALSLMKSPAGEQLFFEKISEVMQDHLQTRDDPLSAPTLDLVRGRILSGKPGESDRYGDLLLSAVRSSRDPSVFQSCVGTSLDLPLAKARSVLVQAYASAPTPETKASVRRVLDLIESGEVRPERLRAVAFQGPLGR
jgi:hypothetical protein